MSVHPSNPKLSQDGFPGSYGSHDYNNALCLSSIISVIADDCHLAVFDSPLMETLSFLTFPNGMHYIAPDISSNLLVES